jgi:hypothetical protein
MDNQALERMPSNNSGSIPNEAPTLRTSSLKAYEAALQFLISYQSGKPPTL